MRVALILVKRLGRLSHGSHSRLMIVSQPGVRAQTERQGGSVIARIFPIALQALGVAGLAAIVYFAFLHPSDPNPLSGIQVEGDIPAGVTPGNNGTGGTAGTAGQRNRKTPVRPGERNRTLAGIRLVPLEPGDAIPAPPAPPGPPVDGDTPTGSQYGSAVARVLGRVARAEP